MNPLKYRIAAIAGLALVSIISLWPREVVESVRDQNGSTIGYDTVRRIPIKQGLDLKGGMYISLAIDESEGVVPDKSEAIDRALTVVRNRIDQLGVAEPNVQKEGDDRIIVELPGIDDPVRARAIVENTAKLSFKLTDETRALERALPAMDKALRTLGVAAGDTSVAAPITPGSLLPNLKTAGDSGAAADSTPPAADSTGLLSSRIGLGDRPGEYVVPAKDFNAVKLWLDYDEVKAAIPVGRELRWGTDSLQLGNGWYRTLYMVESREILSGADLQNAQPQQDPSRGTLVNFEVNNTGGRRFQRETQAHIGDYMAIILDDVVMGRPPVIQGAISTRGQITLPGRPIADAQDLALTLRAGALPVKLTILETRDIGPSLGQDSIDQGVRAAAIAVLLVVLVMGIYYRFAGLLAIAGLSLYMLMTLGALAALEAVITLPGVAGFVLSIGIAVDADVLIFERIREELDAGKTVRTAIEEGFKHAMSAIVDSNVTTILTALILYQFGTGPVRGFAVTLIAGVLASMITGIFIVRTFFLIWLSRNRSAQTVNI